MSASYSFLSEGPEFLREQHGTSVRDWERFKWLAGQLTPMQDRYGTEQLEELFDAPASIPGQQEKVVVLLGLEQSPQATAALERIADKASRDSLQDLIRVALRYARSI